MPEDKIAQALSFKTQSGGRGEEIMRQKQKDIEWHWDRKKDRAIVRKREIEEINGDRKEKER